MRALLIILFFLIGFGTYAQKPKKKKRDKDATEQSTVDPNSLSPYQGAESTFREPKKKKSKSKGPTYDSQQDYYDRMMAVAKERGKAEREMAKPQYSNPMYFGHKRPPKKHKAGKLKYCKECGIRH
ncbi:hypothetical protein SAMN04488109_2396 [Chryseolinea serpens]|uniref:Uncharacterized protein n=1 Tax=Chryseolinea serpens TaxID=947013 RepID=A0A1M5NKZ9_9BACT|nr:hypothetical protein [Chryseolinea serpens]SHG90115.1 hypothetical protein SAMN04488109_2396 [Chryseolinea serpens]